jgi:predicted acylesterase/phospholipase RssA
MTTKRKTIGIALGGGAARGLVHIGVLKVLHKHKIYPDYIAGSSMGAIIGAAYAAGHSPEELEDIANTVDWKKMVDFTVPKSGIIKGDAIEKGFQKLVKNKSFKQLATPLSVIAYNVTKKQKVVFSKGDVAKALRASSSIPGIFSPAIINKNEYIDGVVVDPTPFGVVREMGADIIIAVDLYNKDTQTKSTAPKKGSLMSELREKFVIVELLNIKNLLFPERWPKLIRRFLQWMFDKILYPTKVLRILAKKELPQITKVMYESFNIVVNNYAKERMEHADIDIKLRPAFKRLRWSDFEKVTPFVKLGEKVMEEQIRTLQRKLR